MWNFLFFARRQITGACLFVCLFFSQGVILSTQLSYNVARGLILTEMKSSSALFKWPKNWRAPRPPGTLNIFPKSTDQNSEIAILFSVVEKPYNYVLGDELPPTVPGGGATSYKLWPVLTYSNAYWEVLQTFSGGFFGWGRGWQEGDMLGKFPSRNLSWGEENFHEGSAGFSSIIKKNNEKINTKSFFNWK